MEPTRAKATPLPVLLGLGALAVVALGLIGALIAPRFRNVRIQSRQAEARVTLQKMLTQQEEFRAREKRWAKTPRELVEYAVSGPNNFTCFLGAGEAGTWGGRTRVRVAFSELPAPVQARLAQNDADAPGPDPDLALACAANLDDDPTLDVWTITAHLPTPKHELDDATQ